MEEYDRQVHEDLVRDIQKLTRERDDAKEAICAQASISKQLNIERDRARNLLSKLLARIHRDGGHYEQEHGREKATEDADNIVATMYSVLL